MTTKERRDIVEFLQSRGADEKAIDLVLDSISLNRSIEELTANGIKKKYGKRFDDLKNYEPTRTGKARCTKVGEVQDGLKYATLESGTDDGYVLRRTSASEHIPIYQEDIDNLKRAEELWKQWDEERLKKEVPVSDTSELPTGPDTTECIKEIVDEEHPDRIHPIDIIESCEMSEQPVKTYEIGGQLYTEAAILESVMNSTGTRDRKQKLLKVLDRAKHLINDPDFNHKVDMYSEREKTWVEEKNDMMMDRNGFNTRESEFDRILAQMAETHRKKNADYGNAAHEGYKEYGMRYYLSIIFNKYHRLKTLTLENACKPMVNESIEDTLLDLANYAVLALESLRSDD